jgi:hypothetical protein
MFTVCFETYKEFSVTKIIFTINEHKLKFLAERVHDHNYYSL